MIFHIDYTNLYERPTYNKPVGFHGNPVDFSPTERALRKEEYSGRIRKIMKDGR
jgi:hypothetical protein